MVDEVLQLYRENGELSLQQVRVEFVDELGDDMGGLTKDLYTSLWVQLLQQYFHGESAVVPHLPLYKHMQMRRNFVAIGRILAHTVALLKIVTDDLLLSDFRYYVLSAMYFRHH